VHADAFRVAVTTTSVLGVIVPAVDERSPGGVAGGVSRLIRGGELAPGVRLPTVRELASALGTSPTTVSQAWALLTRAGLISPQGRRGTFVNGEQSPRAVWRVRRTMGSPGRPALDLSTGTPDLALLPDMAAAISRLVLADSTRDYYDEPVIPELEQLLRERWPYEPERLTVVDGAMDAMDRIVAEQVTLGSRVLVENPAYPPLLDLLELVGAQLITLELDEYGVTPASLAAGLAYEPVAAFIQPRAHNPTGASLTRERAAALADLLRATETLVVEDDHAGDIALSAPISLGQWLPDTTVHVRGFSKSYGPDLRLAAMGGPEEIIGPLVDRRLLGPGWSSRMLQHVLLELLCDPATQTSVARARDEYAARREALAAALERHGLSAPRGDGINTWVSVHDEQSVLLAMATHGIGVAAGSPFTVRPLAGDHVRVTSGLLRHGADHVAELLAAADATESGRRRR
jgi:DNA-binding transcriptional MocR family regulator